MNSAAIVHRESLAAFLEFAAEAIGVSHAVDEGLLDLSFDHREHPEWPRPYHAKVAVAEPAIAAPPRRVLSPVEGSQWLGKLVAMERGAVVGRPASQPESIHEFSSRLFDAYQVDGGQAQLAGCHLSEIPFLRVTHLAEENAAEVEHRFYQTDGEPVPEAMLEALHFAHLSPLAAESSTLSRAQIDTLLEKLDVSAERYLATTIVSAKRAEGAVQFAIGDQCARVTFDDWTITLEAPPFHCAATGIDTFRLAAIDDGRIVAAEAMEICEQSGARVLGCERLTCSVTGKRVDPRLVVVCPASGAPLLASETVACDACQQRVSPQVLTGGVCPSCRRLPAARPSDTWVAGLVKRFPALAGYGKYQAGEAGGLVRVMAVGLWRRVLVVTPVGEQVPVVVAMREGLVGGWQQVPKVEWPAVLGQIDTSST